MKPTKEELDKFSAFYSGDTNFAAFARLLQSKWRELKSFPKEKDKQGNYLEEEFAKRTKANFLTEKIKTLVHYEVLMSKNKGKLISEPRIWNNLLSSQPLCFNLFGELHFDLELATKLFKKLFPSKIKNVTNVDFEYSPSRGDENYTNDRSAFDVFVEYQNLKDEKCFVGIEVKYAESLKDEASSHKPRYEEIAKQSGIFKEGSLENLQKKPLQQIWRDHLLSLVMCQNGIYKEGIFVFLFPSKNEECQSSINLYKEQLIASNEEKTGFHPMHLEKMIGTLREISGSEWVDEFIKRYFDNKI